MDRRTKKYKDAIIWKQQKARGWLPGLLCRRVSHRPNSTGSGPPSRKKGLDKIKTICYTIPRREIKNQ